jgi:hypothetical protein
MDRKAIAKLQVDRLACFRSLSAYKLKGPPSSSDPFLEGCPVVSQPFLVASFFDSYGSIVPQNGHEPCTLILLVYEIGFQMKKLVI